MDVKVDMQFKCSKCNTIIQHDYTQTDLLNKTHFELTCQQCGNSQKISTSSLIEKAKQKAIEEFKKKFK